MKWKIGDERNIFETGASDYPSPVDGLYEYIKNLEDEKASEIFVDVDSSLKKVYIYGNSPGLTPERLTEMQNSVGRSNKGIKNHGLGILAYLRIGTSMRIISKTGKKYSTVSCFPKGNILIADSEAHYMNSDEIKRFKAECNKLRYWDHGTLTLIEGVGSARSPRFNFSFDFSKEFGKAKLTKDLVKKIRIGLLLPGKKYLLSYNGKRSSLSPSSVKSSQTISLKIPSPDHPFINSKGVKRNAFTQDGHEYEIKTCILLDLYSREGNSITISFNGQDPLDCKYIFTRNYSGIRNNSIFRGNEFSKFIDGIIDFTIEPLKGGPTINPYSGSRSRLVLEGELKKRVDDILSYVEYRVLPLILEYVGKIKKNTDEIASKRLQEDMNSFISAHREFFNDLMGNKTVEMPVGSGTKCPQCGLIKTPIYHADIRDETKLKPFCIYAIDDEHYLCTHCNNKWKRRGYTAPISRRPLSEKKKNSRNEPATGFGQTNNVLGRALRKRSSVDYTFRITPLSNNSSARYTVVGSMVILNQYHPDYSALKIDRSKKTQLTQYLRELAAQALVDTYAETRDEYKRRLEDVLAYLAKYDFTVKVNGKKGSGKSEIEKTFNEGLKLAQGWNAKLGAQ